MKKTKKTALIAAAFAAAAMGLAACSPTSEQQKVYGPPPDVETETESSSEAEPVSSLEVEPCAENTAGEAGDMQ